MGASALGLHEGITEDFNGHWTCFVLKNDKAGVGQGVGVWGRPGNGTLVNRTGASGLPLSVSGNGLSVPRLALLTLPGTPLEGSWWRRHCGAVEG